MPHSDSDLWECPRCNQKFAVRNLWHSCGEFSLDDLFARSEPIVRETYDAFEKMALAIAPFHVIPQKSRVSFQLRVRCCGGSPRKKYFLAAFILPGPMPDARVSKIEDYGPGQVAHYVALKHPDDVDSQVAEWIRLSTDYGEQRRLRPK